METDAATVMAETISQFQGGSGDSGAPSSLSDIPNAPNDGYSQEEPRQAAAGDDPAAAREGADVNWYEQFLNPQEEPDDLAQLLDPQGFQALQQNPQQLLEWATRAQGQLQTFAQSREHQRKIEQAAEYFGGVDNAELAFQLAGDLFRGEIDLTPEERAEFPNAANYAERFVARVMGQQPDVADALGAAVLNSMPELLKANAGYLLRQVGLDPKYLEDYKRVVAAGGYQIPEDAQAQVEWLDRNGVTGQRRDAFYRLPVEVRADMIKRGIGVAGFELETYAKNFAREDREAQVERQQRQQEMQRVEMESTKTLATETRRIFDEYVEKGKAMGLNPLEAAGVAALAYAEIEGSYWQGGGEINGVLDGWLERIKSGNKLQMDGGRSAYKKAFELAYRKALGANAPRRPQGAQPPAPNGARSPLPIPPANPPQRPAPQASPGHLDPVQTMNEILQQYGAIR